MGVSFLSCVILSQNSSSRFPFNVCTVSLFSRSIKSSPALVGQMIGYFIVYIHASVWRAVSHCLPPNLVHSRCTGSNSCADGQTMADLHLKELDLQGKGLPDACRAALRWNAVICWAIIDITHEAAASAVSPLSSNIGCRKG